uniref:Globin family profile domain-containing protein n=1 Tax=Panagrellus redivivus TaxID=6233 RepID=A0A7E4US08_PANRE
MLNKNPHLRFHGRSLSAREPPKFELNDLNAVHTDDDFLHRVSMQAQHRRLPEVPDRECLTAHYPDLSFSSQAEGQRLQHSSRSSCSSLSPSEGRIRRQREESDKFVKSGSTSRLASGNRLLPSIFDAPPRPLPFCRSSPGSMHLVPDITMTPPTNHKSSHSARRLNFRQTLQRSMGQIDSRFSGNGASREKPVAFSSFDNAQSASPIVATLQKVKPRRFDSTASEDSVVSTEPSFEDKASARFGSSGSLEVLSRQNTAPTVKKFSSGENRMNNRSGGQRSMSTSKTSRTPISPPRLVGGKKTPPISNSAQAIIMYCMDNARVDVAARVVSRMSHKREDFSSFCANMNSEQWNSFVNSLRTYLSDVVRHLQSVEKIREISMHFGMSQVPRRSIGFKADFFAVMANALTTECVFLDGAAHQPTEAIEAWAELIELMFSNVRDGYYQQIRYMRRNSQCFSSMFTQSSDLSTDGSEMTVTAPSTTGTLVHQYSEMNINGQSHSPSHHGHSPSGRVTPNSGINGASLHSRHH